MDYNRDPALFVPELSKQEVYALRNLSKGEATEHQQKLALQIIVNKFSRAHDLTYVPDSFDRSAFLAGRGFVGQQILKFLNIPVAKLKEFRDEGIDETPPG